MKIGGHTQSCSLPYPVDENFNIGEIYTNIAVDKFDDLNFPRAGYEGFVEYIWSDDHLGADDDFQQILIQADGAKTWEEIDNINFADAIFAGSIFLGVDTPIGPVYIGYGQAEGSNNSIYFNLGKNF